MGRYTLYQGHVLDVLKGLPGGLVDCVVTSPPYWGLRNYNLPPLEWPAMSYVPMAGLAEVEVPGCAECEHEWGEEHVAKLRPQQDASGGTRPGTRGEQKWTASTSGDVPRGQWCALCGGWRGCLGLESTPEMYVGHLVLIWRELWRVMKPEATCWLNLGDSYASDSKGGGGPSKKQASNAGSRYKTVEFHHGVKAKDLVGIPWRVAFALQADGWYLRSDIIWSKTNPMPESVKDRPTKSHEYMFLLAKQEGYYYDTSAMHEDGLTYVRKASGFKSDVYLAAHVGSNSGFANKTTITNGRNKRSVWTIPTHPYKGSHFATFPPKLIEPCIKAGCPEGGIVLDPFGGSGTTGEVALGLNRRVILIELSEVYCKELIMPRLERVRNDSIL